MIPVMVIIDVVVRTYPKGTDKNSSQYGDNGAHVRESGMSESGGLLVHCDGTRKGSSTFGLWASRTSHCSPLRPCSPPTRDRLPSARIALMLLNMRAISAPLMKKCVTARECSAKVRKKICVRR